MRGTRGYSLLEVMIVIGLIGILAAVVIPNFMSWRSKQGLLKAADEVQTVIQLARMAAIRENSQVVVIFFPAQRSYTAFVDNGTGGGTAGNKLRDGGEKVLRAGVLANADISLATSLTDNKLVIDTRGFPNPVSAGSVTVSHPKLGNKVVAVTVTGTARVQ